MSFIDFSRRKGNFRWRKKYRGQIFIRFNYTISKRTTTIMKITFFNCITSTIGKEVGRGGITCMVCHRWNYSRFPLFLFASPLWYPFAFVSHALHRLLYVLGTISIVVYEIERWNYTRTWYKIDTRDVGRGTRTYMYLYVLREAKHKGCCNGICLKN